MAKKDLLREAQRAGLVPDTAGADDFTEAQLEAVLGRGAAWEGSLSSKTPLIAPDGHETLTQEDIDARSS